MQTLCQYLQTTYNAAHYSVLIQQNSYSFDWFARLASDKVLHPIITKILDSGEYTPADMPALIGEYPHVSRDDAQQIAYCQNEEKAKRGIYTRGKIGKYVKRHFPTMPDDAIRGIVSHSVLADSISIVDTVGAFIHTVLNGPNSCMARSFDVHPYNCYAPKFGWKMAVRRNTDGKITGRALLNNGVFVRAYVTAADGGYCADTELQDYLKTEGYAHAGAWPKGTKLALIENGGRIVAPYIDGSRDGLDVRDDALVIRDSGEYTGHETSGYAGGQDDCDDENDDDYSYCEDCEDRVHNDETYSVGIDQDRYVCDRCCRLNYTCVEITRTSRMQFGRQYTEPYYMPDDECIRVNGTAYHSEHLPDNIVELHNGDFAESDDAVYIESADEYYLCDDDGIVQLENGDYEMRADAWQCAYSEAWYSDGIDGYKTAPDGAKVHPDNWRDYSLKVIGQAELEFDAMSETT